MNAMDRPIDPTFLRRQRGKRIAYSVVGVAALLWLSVWLPSWIRPALNPRPHSHRAGAMGCGGRDDYRFGHGGTPVRADHL